MIKPCGFSDAEVACWHLIRKFVGSRPAKAVGFLRAIKILRTPSFGLYNKPYWLQCFQEAKRGTGQPIQNLFIIIYPKTILQIWPLDSFLQSVNIICGQVECK